MSKCDRIRRPLSAGIVAPETGSIVDLLECSPQSPHVPESGEPRYLGRCESLAILPRGGMVPSPTNPLRRERRLGRGPRLSENVTQIAG